MNIQTLHWLDHIWLRSCTLPVPGQWYVCCHLMCFHKPFDCTIGQCLPWRISWKANMMSNKLDEDRSSIWWWLNTSMQTRRASTGRKDTTTVQLWNFRNWQDSESGNGWWEMLGEGCKRCVLLHGWSRFECQETQSESSWMKALTRNHCPGLSPSHVFTCITAAPPPLRQWWPSGNPLLSPNSSCCLSKHSIFLVVNNIYHTFSFFTARMMKLTRRTWKVLLQLTLEMDVFFVFFADHLGSRVLTSHRWLPVRIPHGPRAAMCPACWCQARRFEVDFCTPEFWEILYLKAMALSL